MDFTSLHSQIKALYNTRGALPKVLLPRSFSREGGEEIRSYPSRYCQQQIWIRLWNIIFDILISSLQESLLNGYAGTPYENGVFRMKLLLSHDFPHSPPKGYFLTRIFHPNIARMVRFVSIRLKRTGIQVVRCLLIEPFPESALNEQAGKMLLENYEEYARHARIYTGIHAKPKPKFKSGAISESTTALNVGQSIGDQKSVAVGAAVPVQSPLAPCTTASKGGNSQDQPAAVGPMHETGVGGSVVAQTASTLKKDVGLAKVQADKKKIDARKKSLKRL
uniref:UBC core domain-containing protein n=1 Tax=Salix viminalis TaxID=40686 RepID=A0A6N2N6N5_SALVM